MRCISQMCSGKSRACAGIDDAGLEALKRDSIQRRLRWFHENKSPVEGSDGSLLNPDRLSHQFPQLMEQHSLPRYRFHDLRHSSASLLLANGCSLKEIGSWLGHSSIATTNRYAHLMFQSTIDMANSVQSSLFE